MCITFNFIVCIPHNTCSFFHSYQRASPMETIASIGVQMLGFILVFACLLLPLHSYCPQKYLSLSLHKFIIDFYPKKHCLSFVFFRRHGDNMRLIRRSFTAACKTSRRVALLSMQVDFNGAESRR